MGVMSLSKCSLEKSVRSSITTNQILIFQKGIWMRMRMKMRMRMTMELRMKMLMTMRMTMAALIFFKKDNGPDVDMGKNAGVGEPLEEDMDNNEDVYPELPNIFNKNLH
uniref:Uncharacterized protein n=1 Tax=Lactuca sativa TaxID=4236 RepID=A0A9R1XSP4_LACSA|nr:hypothetical protein LSAT_V11C300103540 [Lactuca sativa]